MGLGNHLLLTVFPFFREFLHIITFVGLLLFLPLSEAISNTFIAKFKIEQQTTSSEYLNEEEKSLRRKLPASFCNNNQQQSAVSECLTEEEKSLRRTFHDTPFYLRLLEPRTFLLHFANSFFSTLLVLQRKLQSRKQLNSISDEQDPMDTSLKSLKDKDEIQVILTAAKIFSVSTAFIITFAIIIHSQDSVLNMELIYR